MAHATAVKQNGAHDVGFKLTFDLGKVTAKQMTEFFDANRTNDYDRMSAFFAATVIECPSSWGKPDDPNTYMERPFFTEFKSIIEQFVEATQADSKN